MKKSHLPEILACLVVILALALFALWWKRGSDRSSCIINIRNVQQAVRGYLSVNQSKLFAGYPSGKMWDAIFTGPDALLRKPVCPSGGTYTYSLSNPTNPPMGEVFCTCSHAEPLNHKPDNTAEW